MDKAMQKLGPGTLVLVVGPSGAGKDSLINYARERRKDDSSLVFARRVITRPLGSDAEAHTPVSAEQFQAMLAARRFALHWRAHGLFYGLSSDYESAILAGRTVVANVSRSVVATARRRYADVLTVQVTAPPDVLAERLTRRGREAAAIIDQRLSRPATPIETGELIAIVNDGPLERAGEELLAVLQGRAGKLASFPRVPSCMRGQMKRDGRS